MKEKQEKSHGIHFVMIRRIGSWNCAEEEGAARSFYFFRIIFPDSVSPERGWRFSESPCDDFCEIVRIAESGAGCNFLDAVFGIVQQTQSFLNSEREEIFHRGHAAGAFDQTGQTGTMDPHFFRDGFDLQIRIVEGILQKLPESPESAVFLRFGAAHC